MEGGGSCAQAKESGSIKRYDVTWPDLAIGNQLPALSPLLLWSERAQIELASVGCQRNSPARVEAPDRSGPKGASKNALNGYRSMKNSNSIFHREKYSLVVGPFLSCANLHTHPRLSSVYNGALDLAVNSKNGEKWIQPNWGRMVVDNGIGLCWMDALRKSWDDSIEN